MVADADGWGLALSLRLPQKLFLFALVKLEEKIASSADAEPFMGAPEHRHSDGASELNPNLPKVPGARRRMLLTMGPTAGENQHFLLLSSRLE